jgi:hypothetical protein
LITTHHSPSGTCHWAHERAAQNSYRPLFCLTPISLGFV